MNNTTKQITNDFIENRDIIKKGFAMLGLDQGIVMQACIDGMTAHKDELGLK